MAVMKDMKEKMMAGEEVKMDPETRKKIGCGWKCVMEKRGVWKNGGVDFESLDAKLAEFKGLDKVPNGKEIMKQCAAKKGTDECDTAFEIMKCVKDALPKPPQ